MSKERNLSWFVDQLLWLFRDMRASEINEIMKVFRQNDKLRMDGYGWKRVDVMCCVTLKSKCGWKGKRIWGKNMFKKPCPRCKTRLMGEITTLFCPTQSSAE
ncbi:MAG: hypothetical protein D4Q79_01590 [Spirochaetia bacterium]|nr:MAG: hypothetical protein D4Q79_01590 [Spirochaetia bacterium]